jgi:hypothetical protein
MDGYSVLTFLIFFLLVLFFSVAASRAEQRFWKKCRRSESCIQMQQQITMGKSHLR